MGITFFKNLFRDIKKTLSRFLSIVIIIAIGVSFYAGVRATSPDMKKSADTYFDENNLMDYKLISTLGLTNDDLKAVKNIEGVTDAKGGYSLDAVTEKEGKSLVLNINSVPKQDEINKIKLVSGRLPSNPNEAIVESRFLKEYKLKLGDSIELKSGTEKKIEDNLKNSKFTIVGAAQSPLYISAQRQLSSIGNGSVKGFVYILPSVFKSKFYTEIYVKTNNTESKESMTNNTEYKDSVKKLEERLKTLGEKRVKIRYQEIYDLSKKQISDGGTEINNNKQNLKDFKNPEWYILGRNANVGYETYRQDSDRIDNIGKAFPLIFFLVAALVSLTTMTRMVQENRIEIGTFKALGYSRLAIVSHYLIYSFAASLIGSLLGISFGFKLFPPLIMNAYSSLYTIPNKVAFFNMGIALQACLIAILFTTIAAVGATIEELREVPASLLRPKPPKGGKKILLEYVPFIWRRLKFTQKVTARNILRYKQRFFMTVIGIGACTGLMVTGFGLKAGIVGATQRQFNEIYKYQMITSLKDTVSLEEKDDLKSKVLKDSNIKSTLFYYSKNSSAKKVDSSSEDAYLVVPENNNDINKYIELSNKDGSLKLDDNGVIITQKLSKLINKKLGDTFELTVDNKVYNVKISAITEHYIQHYIYMSPNYYKKVTGKEPVVNSFYGLLKNTSEATEELTSQNLKTIDKINSVSFTNNVKVDFNRSMDSINSVVLILIISAGILAFVVIYNLTNININERRRELATIKLLGFYNNELAAYIYRENIILTVLGSLAGIFIGIFLDNYVVSTAETNVMMFMRNISPIYFLYSILLTIFFSIIVNVAMYKRFDKIDMIESLKSAE